MLRHVLLAKYKQQHATLMSFSKLFVITAKFMLMHSLHYSTEAGHVVKPGLGSWAGFVGWAAGLGSWAHGVFST